MARKTVNRKELREEAEAAERLEAEKPAKTKATKAAKAADGTVKKPARKSRAKTTKEVRMKAYWGVFNQSMKRIALFEYSQRPEADKKVNELNASQKSPHFVLPVKEAIQE